MRKIVVLITLFIISCTSVNSELNGSSIKNTSTIDLEFTSFELTEFEFNDFLVRSGDSNYSTELNKMFSGGSFKWSRKWDDLKMQSEKCFFDTNLLNLSNDITTEIKELDDLFFFYHQVDDDSINDIILVGLDEYYEVTTYFFIVQENNDVIFLEKFDSFLPYNFSENEIKMISWPTVECTEHYIVKMRYSSKLHKFLISNEYDLVPGLLTIPIYDSCKINSEKTLIKESVNMYNSPIGNQDIQTPIANISKESVVEILFTLESLENNWLFVRSQIVDQQDNYSCHLIRQELTNCHIYGWIKMEDVSNNNPNN